MRLHEELCGRSKILYWAGKYDVDYDICIENLVPEVKKRGYLTKCELIEVAEWVKSRRLDLVKTNSSDDVERFTQDAFRVTVDDSLCYLRCLDGVSRITGSAILHWFHEGRYPIWVCHTIWSVQLDKRQYRNNFERWKAYVDFCRFKADEYEVCMRTLDRALKRYGQANKLPSC